MRFNIMELHESISRSYADVGKKALSYVSSRPGSDPLTRLPVFAVHDLQAKWRAWLAIQFTEKEPPRKSKGEVKKVITNIVPPLDAPEKDYQPVLERLLQFLLAPAMKMLGNKYVGGLRPDVSVIAKEELYLRWSNLLWCAELETNLQEKYHHGLRQAWTYSGEAMLRQRNRKLIFVVR